MLKKTLDKKQYKIAIVAPTPFYYQVDLFRELAAHPRIELTVYFCSKEALRGDDILKVYKTSGHWGGEEEWLKGYNYKFLRNYSPFPSYIRWPFGLMNFGIWNEIKKEKPDAVILMAWTNLTWWLATLACLYSNVPFFYMTDANIRAELSKPKLLLWLKRLLLGKWLFKHTSGFLCAGTLNKILYRYYGVPEEKLVSFAYSWGYKALLPIADDLKRQRKQIKTELGIPEESFVILFCGRLSKEKKPFDLLKAYHQVNSPHKALSFVGDGKLKKLLQEYIINCKLNSVFFFGFQNRKEIFKFYAISDVLVVPSSRETWGIVVNEAMCFGLPIIVADCIGSSKDLVQHGYNGFIFPRGDIKKLASYIEELMALPEKKRSMMGNRSLEIIKKWLEKDLAETLVQCLDFIFF